MPLDDDILSGGNTPGWRDALPQKKGTAREVKAFIYAILAAVLLGAVIALFLLLWNPAPSFGVAYLPVRYDTGGTLQKLVDLPAAPLGISDAELLHTSFSNDLMGSKFIKGEQNTRQDQYTIKAGYQKFIIDPKVRAADRVILFISALGKVDQGKVYLLPGDFDEKNPASWIEVSEFLGKTISKLLNDTPEAKKKCLVLLDLASPTANVHSGPMKNEVSTELHNLLREMVQKQTLPFPVVTACDRGQVSLPLCVESAKDGTSTARQSVFAYYFRHGLMGEAVDDRQKITVQTLAAYLKNRVNHWTVSCLDRNQEPQLYLPHDFPSEGWELRRNVTKPVPLPTPTAPAPKPEPTTPAGPETEETRKEKLQKEAEKQKKLLDDVERLYFHAAIQESWAKRDQLFTDPAWRYHYTAIQQWTQKLLTRERCFQASGEDLPKDTETRPSYPVHRLGTLYSLHQMTSAPAATPAEAKPAGSAPEPPPPWETYKLDDKTLNNPEPPDWIAPLLSKPDQKLLATQALWKRLVGQGKIDLKQLRHYHLLLTRLNVPCIEVALLKALTSLSEKYGVMFDEDHAENYLLLLQTFDKLEAELAQHVSDPHFFPLFQPDLSAAEKLFQQSFEAQVKRGYADGDNTIRNNLRDAIRRLDTLSERRGKLTQAHQNYWEALRLLVDTSEQVVYANAVTYPTWLSAAKATLELGGQLDQAMKSTSLDLPPFQKPNLDLLRVNTSKDAFNLWEKESTTPSDLLSVLHSTSLSATQRQQVMKFLMIKWNTRHKIVQEQDKNILENKRFHDPLPAKLIEAQPDARRQDVSNQLQDLQKGMPHPTPAAVGSPHQQLGTWMSTRLQTHDTTIHKLFDRIRPLNQNPDLKIDPIAQGVYKEYAGAIASCKQLAEVEQK